nr:unnamed protein product [Haemonchus contortus]
MVGCRSFEVMIAVKLFPETLEVLTTSQSAASSERHVSTGCDLQDGSCTPVRRSVPREGCGTICKQSDSECRRVAQSSVQSEGARREGFLGVQHSTLWSVPYTVLMRIEGWSRAPHLQSARSNRGSRIDLIVFGAHFFDIQSASPKSASHIQSDASTCAIGYGNSRPEAK